MGFMEFLLVSLFHISIPYLYTYLYLSIPIVSPRYLFPFPQGSPQGATDLSAVQIVDRIYLLGSQDITVQIQGSTCTNTFCAIWMKH